MYSTTTETTMEEVIQALRHTPKERLPDILQFIEFVEYQAIHVEDDTSEDEALWTAVEVERGYRQRNPEDVTTYSSINELRAALETDE